MYRDRGEGIDYGFNHFLKPFKKSLLSPSNIFVKERKMRLFSSYFQETKLKRKSILCGALCLSTLQALLIGVLKLSFKEAFISSSSVCMVQKGLICPHWPRNGDWSTISFHPPGFGDGARDGHMTHINPIHTQFWDFGWKEQKRKSFPENEGATEKSRSDRTLVSSFQHLNPAVPEIHSRCLRL